MHKWLARSGGIAVAILPLACTEAPRSHVVDIRNFVYAPTPIELQPGDTIVFVNHDVVPHTATARDTAWDTGEILPGDTVRVVPNAGEYFCVYHPNMTAVVAD